MAEIDNTTGLPKTVKLGDVFADIELAPAQVGALLHHLAYQFMGGAHEPMARSLIDAGNKVTDASTYGNAPENPTEQQQQAAAQSNWGAAQAQSTLPASGTTQEPSWMRDARAAGWAGPTESPREYRAPAGPDVDPKYRAPYTTPAEQSNADQPVDVSPGTPSEPSAPPIP